MDFIIEDEKSISTGSNTTRGTKSKFTIKTQKKLSFTPTQSSSWNSRLMSDDDDDKTIISFDSSIFSNESNESFISKSVLCNNISNSTKSNSISLTESFHLFEEEYPDIIESLRRFSRGKTAYVADKKKQDYRKYSNDNIPMVSNNYKRKTNDDKTITTQTTSDTMTTLPLISGKSEEFENMTNIQEIQNFNEYTNDCMRLIARMPIPEQSTLSNRYIELPFASNVGFGNGKKRLAVFDLDETLIHCELKEEDIHTAQTIIEVVISSSMRKTIGLNVRPYLKEELTKLKEMYHLIVYTASQQKYADSVLNTIDPDNELFEYRLYRNNCTLVKVDDQALYVKDLRIFKNISLRDMIIIDNSVLSFAFHLNNGVPILPYYKGNDDSELRTLRNFLEILTKVSDMQAKLRNLMHLEEKMEKCKEEEDFELDIIDEVENSNGSIDNSQSSNSSSFKNTNI